MSHPPKSASPASPAPAAFEQFRADAVGRMFARSPRLAMVIFEPTFAGLCLYVAFTAVEGWRRGMGLGLLAALVAINVLPVCRTGRVGAGLRWTLGIALIAITGGGESPLLPFMLISVLSAPSILGRRAGLMKCGSSIVALWAMTLLQGHGHRAAFVHAGCMTLLLVGAYAVGTWIRETSDLMLRSSLEVREELLRTYGERLRELTRLQESLAHELKNPLASIKGLASLMELEPARAPERLGVLRQEVGRMQRIVEEILTFARPLTPIIAETTDLRATVDAVVRLHEGLARHKHLTLDASQADCVEVVGDPQKVKQILMNLVRNAIEASEPGGAIELTAKRHGDRVSLCVLDRGPGVAAELLTRVVEPGVTTKEEGSGLGLTIVRALAEQHGGSLRLRNRDGGGLAAEVDLPLCCPRGRCDQQLV